MDVACMPATCMDSCRAAMTPARAATVAHTPVLAALESRAPLLGTMAPNHVRKVAPNRQPVGLGWCVKLMDDDLDAPSKEMLVKTTTKTATLGTIA